MVYKSFSMKWATILVIIFAVAALAGFTLALVLCPNKDYLYVFINVTEDFAYIALAFLCLFVFVVILWKILFNAQIVEINDSEIKTYVLLGRKKRSKNNSLRWTDVVTLKANFSIIKEICVANYALTDEDIKKLKADAPGVIRIGYSQKRFDMISQCIEKSKISN